jgi:hypothetical protein
MKPAPYGYARAATLDDVFSLLAEHGEDAKILAGGQSLMATLNMRLSEPEVLIDINRIDGLAGIQDTGDTIRIGAMTRHVDVEESDVIATHAPLITAAMEHVAHPAIRNRGTFGGSIAFADPAAEMPACAVALGATMHIAGKGGTRDIACRGFLQRPVRDRHRRRRNPHRRFSTEDYCRLEIRVYGARPSTRRLRHYRPVCPSAGLGRKIRRWQPGLFQRRRPAGLCTTNRSTPERTELVRRAFRKTLGIPEG